jgi:hypothetical protein
LTTARGAPQPHQPTEEVKVANQILVDNFPGGRSIESAVEVFRGSIALAGSAVSTGEPLNWANMVSGVGYNSINREGGGQHGRATALVTAFSASTGTVTATAANNFQVGQLVTFVGLTTTLGLLLNGITVQIVTASATQFTFLSSATGSGSSEVGLAVTANSNLFPLQGANAAIAATVTALSASGGIVTVTAANTYLPGAQVVVTSSTSGIGATISGQTLTVLSATATAFKVTSSATGATGTGTASAVNPPQPFSVDLWSENASGIVYQYSRATGVLFALVQGAAAQAALAPLTAGVYPAAVLGDVIRYQASFAKA